MESAPITMQWVAALLFAVALAHTFATPVFHHLARKHPRHAGAFHLLAEVEAVFGCWAMIMMVCMFFLVGKAGALAYLDTREFTEPLFVFAVMVVAASRPIVEAASHLVRWASAILPVPRPLSLSFCLLALVPLLGSLITEPAAMTLAAMLLRDRFFSAGLSTRLRYAIVGCLFVNISIGGLLTPFSAPPVLMVAAKWGWDIGFMLSTFGWKAAIAVAINAVILAWLFRSEIMRVPMKELPEAERRPSCPPLVTGMSLLFLFGIVFFAHNAEVYLGLLIFFLGFAHAYPQYQDRLILREAFLIPFFLAGLVVLGGQQQWWLKPLLLSMSDTQVFFGAVALTAVTDNAALTYLGSLV